MPQEIKLHLGDCLEVMKTLPENSVDSIVTDPPYELGFMGKSWDSTGIANNPEMWKECLRVLKPGGYLLSFGGTRTYHRMASAIEDAGFEVRDMIEWVYGSGFPKSLNIGKAVDKIQGNERIKTGVVDDRNKNTGLDKLSCGGTYGAGIREYDKGTSEWEGWGTALKPAHEPICMARKPLGEKTVAENVLKYGTGGINIDESRVEIPKGDDSGWSGSHAVPPAGSATDAFGVHNFKEVLRDKPEGGRFPANLIHDGSEEVRECFPENKSTQVKGVTRQPRQSGVWDGENNGLQNGSTEIEGYNDSGNASRFFKSIIYQAKASKSERNAGLDVVEDSNKRPQGEAFGDDSAITEHSERKGNFHPTVKPIALMEYLIKMVTREGQTVLDPFMGSGTTGVACKKLNRNFIGIEMSEEYMEICKARIDGVEIEAPKIEPQQYLF